MLPHESYHAETFFKRNLIGGNLGNLLYTNGIIRNIVTDQNYELVSNYYKYSNFNPKEINQEYSAFIIPLADAFRADFTPELNKLTSLVKSLKIPCYVIGVGLRDSYEPTFQNGFAFDGEVKKFVSAVLEKSAAIGVRGQITADYLTKLGFKEGRDHFVIGCPSMYTFGPNLHVENPKITSDSYISLNASINAPDVVKKVLTQTAKEIPHYTFVPQTINELKYLYTGVAYNYNKKRMPYYSDHNLFEGEHCKFFLSAQSWFDYFKDIDLSFGSRLHGNVAALLSNTPCIFLPKDARERELNDVHHFNSFPTKDLTENTTVWELIEKSDFSGFEKYQKENYQNFLNFLDLNKIDHIDQSIDKNVPYENYLKNTEVRPPVKSFRTVSERERGNRLYHVYGEQPKKKPKAPAPATTETNKTTEVKTPSDAPEKKAGASKLLNKKLKIRLIGKEIQFGKKNKPTGK